MTTKEQLITKLYRGECTRDELEYLLDLIQQEPEKDHAGIMEQLWEQLRAFPELDTRAASAIMENTLAKIEKLEADASASEVTQHRDRSLRLGRRLFFRTASVAAAILLLISVAFWWLQAAETMEVRTAFGEQRTFELPDRSIVKLNANSSITFRKRWTSKEIRQVWLEGEAYFEVRKEETKKLKFQVITRDLTVEVLGTVFNVNTREAATEVFLEEGRINVDLQAAEENILMEPGELVTYSIKSRRPPLKKKVLAEAPASWKDGTVLFRDKPLGEIIRKMEELYGLSAVVRNQTLLNRKFNVSIPVGNVDTAYLVLREVTGLEIEKKGDQLIVK